MLSGGSRTGFEEYGADRRRASIINYTGVDARTMEYRPIENPNIALGGGAGIQSAQLIAQQEVHTVMTGNCGPNAFQTLSAAGNDAESIEHLKNQIKTMEEQLASLKERIREKGERGAMAHPVDRVVPDRCTGCTVCQNVCPRQAIVLETA